MSNTIGRPGVSSAPLTLTSTRAPAVEPGYPGEELWAGAAGMSLTRLIVKPRETKLSGVRPKAAAIGRAVVDLVIDKLDRNEFGPLAEPRVALVEEVWNDGATTRPSAATPAA